MPPGLEHRGIFTSEKLQAYLANEPRMHVEPLGKDLWTITDGHCRSIFAEGRNSVVAFDTFGTPGRARAYRKAIGSTVPGKPIATIVYSHDHLDHAGFAADLAPEAEIIADGLNAQVIGLRQAEGQLAPTRTVEGERNTIELDGLAFELINPGPTHGSGNLAAYFPEHKLLFMSDTILPNACYGLLPDYHLRNFVSCMRGLLALDFEIFIPGRYGPTDRRGFETGCDYKARQILSVNRHNTIVYPSFTLKGAITAIRVVKPVAVDKTIVESWVFRQVGAPEELFRRSITYCNIINSHANLVGPDDWEAYHRVQQGLPSRGTTEWVSLHRFKGKETLAADGTKTATGTSDMVFRHQFQTWKTYMTGSNVNA